jgi:hypothetical protein
LSMLVRTAVFFFTKSFDIRRCIQGNDALLHDLDNTNTSGCGSVALIFYASFPIITFWSYITNHYEVVFPITMCETFDVILKHSVSRILQGAGWARQVDAQYVLHVQTRWLLVCLRRAYRFGRLDFRWSTCWSGSSIGSSHRWPDLQ